MMTIKLRDYLRLHPNQGVELLTEFGYYTLTKQEIKTQLRKHGAVRLPVSQFTRNRPAESISFSVPMVPSESKRTRLPGGNCVLIK